MQIQKRLAAIDIGSNAIRMVISDYTPKGFRFLKKFRFPIRLGGDVFEKGKISGKNMKESARTFRKFKELTSEFKVTGLRAVGTSALREAKNQSSFVELIRRKSQINIEVIDGVEEARLIHLAVKKEIYLENHICLLIDVGGGSVELTLSQKGQMIGTQSFPMGTVRILERLRKRDLAESQMALVLDEFMEPISHFLKSIPTDGKIDFAVGTGGNLETLGKLKPVLLRKASRNLLTLAETSEIVARLTRMTYKDRVEKLKLRTDRADVIVPAARLIYMIMSIASIDKIYIPGVGLKDGLLWSMLT